MNKSLGEALELVNAIGEKAPERPEVIKIIIPPFPYLQAVEQALDGLDTFYTGAQNCHTHTSGAYTGEVSATMLQSVGCRYVLVGHSERRQYFKEDAATLRLKMEQAFAAGLLPIYCIGETLDERKANHHFEVVKQQLSEVLSGFGAEQMASVVLAYEPVWAIGTGETATSAQAQEMHAHIRSVLKTLFSESMAEQTPVLYGGSCNAQNAPELFACPDVDGGLIGGASLKAEEFCKIMDSF